uniref:Uncharacterized protein n=1 Tax=Ciona intestinalis TaxID=7719 RepID=H2XZ26_CIOIN
MKAVPCILYEPTVPLNCCQQHNLCRACYVIMCAFNRIIHRSQPTEETPLQPVAAPKVTENVVTENGDNGSDVKASLMQNEQPTPANSPLDGAAEPKDVIKPDDVAVAVDNQASTVEETHA